MRKLHIDIETYSSARIEKVGVYKYVESPDFEILLIAYALDRDPVDIIDVTKEKTQEGTVSEELSRFLYLLANPDIIKCAHNTAFERLAFERVGYSVPVEQWECTMVKSAYCGLPLSLDQVSKALQLEEKGKLSTGNALIRYFCKPCKPTKINKGRTRNLPEHNPEKWEEFKKYCIQDVVAEREIDDRLRGYELPEMEKTLYVLDQEINDRGIKIDTQFAQNAYDIDIERSKILSKKMINITNLENPNSPAQLKEWLSEAMNKNITTLAKGELPTLIEETEDGAVKDVLKLRQKLAKTSTKKYTSMLNCTCNDGRAHGLFQFYGANRTGRWAGRLIQLQNLPQNKIKDLDLARELVAENNLEVLTLLYDDVPSILSQLIRTAFVAPEGYTFAVADFSSIEARVLAWLAGEDWKLKVFNTHGKIYEASAAAMFGIPVEQINSSLRQKGKVAELALGYQGAINALKKMGGEQMGLTDPEMNQIVKIWRVANPNIVKFWKRIENGAKTALTQKNKPVKINKLVFLYDGKALTIQLPSGRKLFYQNPSFTINKFGNQSIKYKGMNQTTKRWEDIDTYGGKLTENVVQAIARDLLAFAMYNLRERGYNTVMHVHDEVVCEILKETHLIYPNCMGTPESQLKAICKIMSITPNWACDLPLNADGYLTDYYKKD
jgi:DNA polymerase